MSNAIYKGQIGPNRSHNVSNGLTHNSFIRELKGPYVQPCWFPVLSRCSFYKEYIVFGFFPSKYCIPDLTCLLWRSVKPWNREVVLWQQITNTPHLPRHMCDLHLLTLSISYVSCFLLQVSSTTHKTVHIEKKLCSNYPITCHLGLTYALQVKLFPIL